MRSQSYQKWDEEEIELLKELYPNHSESELAEIFDRSIKSITTKAFVLNIKKSPEYMRELNSIKSQNMQDGSVTWKQFKDRHKKYVPILKECYNKLMFEWYLKRNPNLDGWDS